MTTRLPPGRWLLGAALLVGACRSGAPLVATGGGTGAARGDAATGGDADTGGSKGVDDGGDGDLAGEPAPLTFTLSELVGGVGACAAGAAHPNVCCELGRCVEQPDAPFAACSATALTFPDRGRCCPLEGGPCADAPDVDAGAAADPRACALPCSPAGKPASASPLPFGACSNQASQSLVACEYCCEGLGCVSDVCHCPPELPDGGVCQCNTPDCDSCPSGWQVAASQVDLCCKSPTVCFSQAAIINPPELGGGSSSGPGTCAVDTVIGIHTYEVSCDVSSTPQCTCFYDGAPTRTFAMDETSCTLGRCGFPP